MKKLLLCTLLLPFWFAALPTSSGQTSAPQAVVRAVLFFSPNCGHCHFVISETLPPLFEQYGDQLHIVGVDVTEPNGQALFLAALEYFNLENSGVPLLVIGDTYLVGSVDIPEQLPGLIDTYLAQGGLDWPAIPGLAEALAASQPAGPPTVTPLPAEAAPTTTAADLAAPPARTAPTQTPIPGVLMTGGLTGGALANFARDPLGNGLAVIVLAAMIFSMSGIVFFFRRTPGADSTGGALTRSYGWLIPVLCLAGLGVAGYLAYVETTQVEAVCGPVGDCNSVQQSEYARLFGILPIGILGMAGYVLILLAWILGRYTNQQRKAALASLLLFGMSVFGVLFSIYLTFLEPFVIGATCAWCLTSALILTALLWLSLAPGKLAFDSLFHGDKHALERPDSQRAS